MTATHEPAAPVGTDVDTDPATLHPITITVNGTEHRLRVEGRRLLVDVLRQDLRLTGTRTGCDQGVCGVCTVRLDGRTVRSCITLAVQADGADVRTIEGVAPDASTLHPIQQAFWEKQGLQCGFCTPGMVLRVQEILEENPTPTRAQVREGISSNLCRCTGYQFIVDAAIEAAAQMAEDGS
ncbi:Carbon-monoxide dehydrogenase (acceptor) [Pseudonocardia dioxanivorans CB1190]|uniref:Carbon-monoxide dehydrogenase (Acceptor) n=1 Tax=Pseudonocardia dioxanivorans (strain ATCC 55486 / DSM 44775 / JCM 13855 / CB1190) TaxID=675635 RepID=F4CPG7_PSEUX|nr:(2Fe-2S)-binding protein [Pseudonocardia dioxanivorans]AEA24465.1 Carbon-monoxide dehydrogenase (acceptor) [Pseudonocardia dioxanivorans CB1190]